MKYGAHMINSTERASELSIVEGRRIRTKDVYVDEPLFYISYFAEFFFYSFLFFFNYIKIFPLVSYFPFSFY